MESKAAEKLIQNIFDSDDEEEEERKEELVPIRLNVLVDNYRIQDAFTWNLYEDQITPEQFAETLCAEMDVPPKAEHFISTSIRQQLNDFVENLENRKTEDKENIYVIRLDISLNGVSLFDQFEWDINNPLNSPEGFAKSLCNDLGLTREFEVAVAHSIREQISFFKNATIDDLQSSVEYYQRPSPVHRGVRKETELPMWTPVVGNTSQMEIFNRKRYQEGNVLASPYQLLREKKRKRERREERRRLKALSGNETTKVEDDERDSVSQVVGDNNQLEEEEITDEEPPNKMEEEKEEKEEKKEVVTKKRKS